MHVFDIGVGARFDEQLHHVEVYPALHLAPVDLLMRRTSDGKGQGIYREAALPIGIVEGFVAEIGQRRVFGQHFGHEAKVFGVHGADPLFFLVKSHRPLP